MRAPFELGDLRGFGGWHGPARGSELLFCQLRHGPHLDLHALELGLGASCVRIPIIVLTLRFTLCALFALELTVDASELGVEFGVLRAKLRVDRVQRLPARRRALLELQHRRQEPAKIRDLLDRRPQGARKLPQDGLALALGALAFSRDRHELMLQHALAREHAIRIRQRERRAVRRLAVVGQDRKLPRIEDQLFDVWRATRRQTRPGFGRSWLLALGGDARALRQVHAGLRRAFELEVPEVIRKIEGRAEDRLGWRRAA
ncbi:MAG TPA: hypothetical protein VHM19_19835 [Polyangiales bacterium]|nr:hypothetical protein [Polyangiales bacterium]